MGRLPFDPGKTAAARAAAAKEREGGERLTVAQLATLIEGALRDHLPRKLRVVGEISGFKEQTHWYFSLKDADAVVGCVMWQGAARLCALRPQNGQEVVVTGRVEYWAKQGRTQFYVEKLEPVGAGALDLEFQRLCEELRGLGWFAPERKRPVPRFPRRVAVVTSATGAALQDVRDTMRKRCAAVSLALVDVRVQGDGAARDVAAALRWIGRVHQREGIDVVLVTRGGGSREDLWTFNERIVAQAIVECPIPVVAAIGHETDTSIAELVADERCATPTQAAMRLTPDAAALTEQLDALGARLAGAAMRICRTERERLRAAARHPFFTDPRAIIIGAGMRVETAHRRLRSGVAEVVGRSARRMEAAGGRLERHRPAAVYERRRAELARVEQAMHTAIAVRIRCADVEGRASRLEAAWRASTERAAIEVDAAERGLELVGPISVMRRGFSCTLREDGTAVRSIADVHGGEVVRTRVVDGTFTAVVRGEGSGEGAMQTPAASPGAWASRRQRKRRASGVGGAGDKSQMKLFGGGK